MIAAICRWLCRTFPTRSRIVPRADDGATPLLTQFMVLPNIVYLQHFEGPESVDFFHRHRWAYMRSLVLSGYYVEERPNEGLIVRGAGHSHKMDHSTIHRVDFWSHDCWTLFFMWKPSDDWGYYPRNAITDAGFIPWRNFVKRRVPALETGKIIS
jgi:hypothetical protein